MKDYSFNSPTSSSEEKGINPIKGKKGASILGPKNPERESQSPDLMIPPSTDNGTLPNMWFPFSDTHMRLEEGGWSREVTVRDLPISTTIAAVNMRLTPGGARELHWHKAAEWAIMLEGHARLTAIDSDGNVFIDDVKKGDLWYFPSGVPHSIQGLEDGCEFLLVFDDGSFSESNTFSITDWFAHTPKDVLANNFDVREHEFDQIPDEEVYMYQGEIPGSIEKEAPENQNPKAENWFSYHLMEQEPLKTDYGSIRIVDSRTFKASKTIAAVLVEVEPGGIRELHWHTNNDEWQYYLQGQGRMTVFASGGEAGTFDFKAGDVGYVPYAMGHYIQNTGNETLVFLEMFKSDRYIDFSLNQWMAMTPPRLLKEHLHLSDHFIQTALHKEDRPVVGPSKKEDETKE